MEAPKKPQKAQKSASPEGGAPDDAATSKPALFELKKNHGLVLNGRASQFFEAGTTFDPEADADTIALLAKSGAILEQQ